MRFDSHGIPILSLADKVEALRYCIETSATEDAIGHLVDLLHHVAPGTRFRGEGPMGRVIDGYADRPTPIEDD